MISNALLIKASLPEVPICVDAACCAGVTPESHENALKAMEMCRSKFSGKKDRIIKIKRKVKTTRLAGGLLCPYKGLFPACARKAH